MRNSIPVCLAALLATCAMPAAAVDDAAVRACRAIADMATRVACYDRLPLPPLPAAGSAASAASESEARFGAAQLPASQQPAEAPAISSVIPGDFTGWDANTRWTLANGQVWAIADGSRAVYRLKDPKVVLTRGVSGTFFIEIEGVGRTPRVRRIQ